MMNGKSAIISCLICINLFLLTALVIFGVAPPAAVAQGTGLADQYMVVTGQIQSQFDALYLLDLRARTLHVFYFIKGGRDLEWAGYRDLERDFRNN